MHRRPRSTPRRLLTLALALALAVAGCSKGTPEWEAAAAERSTQARQAALDAGLSAEVAEVAATAASSVAATYTVSYDVTDAGGVHSVITVTQRPPNRRIDVVPDSGNPESIFLVDGESTRCTKQGAWLCQAGGDVSAMGGFARVDLERTITALAATRDTFHITATDDEIAGVAARCIEAQPKDDSDASPDRLCVDGEGVLLEVQKSGGVLRAAELSRALPDKAFELPAEARPGPSTTVAG